MSGSLGDAMLAIDDFFKNCRYTQQETLDGLEQIKEEIEMKIDAIKIDLVMQSEKGTEE